MFLGFCSESRGKTVLKQRNKRPVLVDRVVYRRGTRTYRIWKGKTVVTLRRDDIDYVRPPKPKGFDTCRDIATLEATMKKYRGQTWDIQAFKRLMPLYVKAKAYGKAVTLYRDMKRDVGRAMPLSVTRTYWDALRLSGRTESLKGELKEAIRSGSRETAAAAYLALGDLLLGEGQRKDALVEGYLKTVVLLADVGRCRRDALSKTIAVMEEMGDTRALKFRKMLEKEFPDTVPVADSR
jgi:hypothetical protein